MRDQSECGKTRARKTMDTETFHVVERLQLAGKSFPDEVETLKMDQYIRCIKKQENLH